VPETHKRVYETVRAARDASLAAAQEAWRSRRDIQGWQLDEAARQVIIQAGFRDFIRHRTGHSLSPGQKVHGMGMNLDSIESQDTRVMLPDTGFTIEPGVYLPEFGVRSEINVYVDPTSGPVVTSCLQTDVVLM
jgi:Xaa-Pro aminopeptidase